MTVSENSVFIGRLDTSSFSWLVCGSSEAHVQELMETAWNKHRRDTGARWDWADVEDSLYIIKMQPGQVQKN